LLGLLLRCSFLRGHGWRCWDVGRRGGLLFCGWLCSNRLLAAGLLPLRLFGCLLGVRLLLFSGGGCRLSGRCWRGRLLFLGCGGRSVGGVGPLSRRLLWLGLRWCRLLSSLRVSLASAGLPFPPRKAPGRSPRRYPSSGGLRPPRSELGTPRQR